MVERLKAAVEKARAQRTRRDAQLFGRGRGAPTPDIEPEPPAHIEPAPDPDLWARLEVSEPNWRRFERERIVTWDKSNPAHVAFDSLRTRIMKAFKDHGWTRLAITSPTRGCGKTMVAANLAFSFARHVELRTLLFDMDLRAPSLARRLGVGVPFPVASFLNGEISPGEFLTRVGDNLALGLNDEPVRAAAEMAQSRRATTVLAEMLTQYQPHMVIYDLPPMLIGDEVLAFLPNVDAVLLVAAAGQTKAAEISECERLIAQNSQLLGVMLNKSTEQFSRSYAYNYGS